MAVVDPQHRTITVKIVYYGCAMGGKTTNLVTLHRLTDPANTRGLVSIATQDDRTLFFDLLPIDLGQVGGMQVKVKVYTVPGQVHYETTRRQVLAGVDGVVMVIDSNQECRQQNQWACTNLRLNLQKNRIDPDEIPIVMQWNKRDLESAVAVQELESTLNPNWLKSHEAVATTGVGVVETFGSILEKAVSRVYRLTGRESISDETIAATVQRALAQARAAAGESATAAHAFDHRFDMEGYRDQQAELGRDRRIVDQESLLSEAVNTNMKLAERLDGFAEMEASNERRSRMMGALGRLAPGLVDPAVDALPRGTLALLLEGAGRTHGSLLLFKSNEKRMDVREAAPRPDDPLNEPVEGGLGSVAYRLAQEGRLRVIEDLQGEIFFDRAPDSAAELASALVAPLRCDGLGFGALCIYSRVSQPAFDDAEREYWKTATIFLGLSLHWRALRRKLAKAQAT